MAKKAQAADDVQEMQAGDQEICRCSDLRNEDKSKILESRCVSDGQQHPQSNAQTV
tara:strand:+ start:16876 stop:17043 length:168 start_codon:yes stop_codon:yes gene_type:complete